MLKGWEIYAWLDAGERRFSLLPGTNMIKDCDTIVRDAYPVLEYEPWAPNLTSLKALLARVESGSISHVLTPPEECGFDPVSRSVREDIERFVDALDIQ